MTHQTQTSALHASRSHHRRRAPETRSPEKRWLIGFSACYRRLRLRPCLCRGFLRPNFLCLPIVRSSGSRFQCGLVSRLRRAVQAEDKLPPLGVVADNLDFQCVAQAIANAIVAIAQGIRPVIVVVVASTEVLQREEADNGELRPLYKDAVWANAGDERFSGTVWLAERRQEHLFVLTFGGGRLPFPFSTVFCEDAQFTGVAGGRLAV